MLMIHSIRLALLIKNFCHASHVQSMYLHYMCMFNIVQIGTKCEVEIQIDI